MLSRTSYRPSRKNLLLIATAMLLLGGLSTCSKKPVEATRPVASAARESSADGLALAPRMGGNVQGVFMKKRMVNGKYFYQYPAIEELGITLTRGISGTGSTFSRYGDPAIDPRYAGLGWQRAAADYPGLDEAQKVGKKRTPETENDYRSWIDMAANTSLKDLVVVANPYMPFSELAAFLDDAAAAGANVLWLEAGNEMNSPVNLKAWQEQLLQTDPRVSSYNGSERVEKAFDQYWDWVEELESFARARNIPVAYVGTPPAYAFPGMLDPETMGAKANQGAKKAQSDRMFNETGSRLVRSGRLAGAGVSRHRYSQWDIVDREIQERNDDLRRRLSYPLARNYYEDLLKTEVDFYRKLYPGAKILLTEWALRKSIAGAGYSMAASIDVAKFLIAMGQINAQYRENVVELVTYQNLYSEKMGGLIYFEGSEVGLSPEGLTFSLFSVMDGRPILEVGRGDNINNQWLRLRGEGGEVLVYYNTSATPFTIPYSGQVRYLQSEDILGSPSIVQSARAERQVPAFSVGVVELD